MYNLLSIITNNKSLSNKQKTIIIMKYMNNSDVVYLKNCIYTTYTNIHRYDSIIMVSTNTLEIYKYGIVIDKYRQYVSLLINNKYTLTINSNEYYIFKKKKNKRNKYIQLLESLS